MHFSACFCLLFTGVAQDSFAIQAIRRSRRIAKIADLLGALPMTAPLIAQFPPVHVNFARENPRQSSNYHDNAAT
jgi:hypothetical protein